MRLFLILASFLLSSLSWAQIGYPIYSKCQITTYSDSYGRGVESVFTGLELRHRYNDETCYQIGREVAEDALANEDQNWCRRDYERAYKEGFKSSPYGAGSRCHILGYVAGHAALGVGAREGDVESVGKRCVDAYQKGRADGKASRVSSPRTTNDPELFCYSLGHFEAPLFN